MKFENWLLDKRHLIFALTLMLVGGTGYQLTKAHISDDLRMFFGADNPHLLALEAYEDTYVKNNFVILGVYTEKGTVFTREALSALKELTQQSWSISHVLRADSMSNFQLTEMNADGDLVVQAIYDDPTLLTEEQLQSIQATVLAHPDLAGRLVSEDGRLAALSINLNLSRGVPGSKEAAAVVAEELKILMHQIEQKYSGIEIRSTGGIYADQAFSSATIQDLTTLMPLVAVLMTFLMYFFLRSVAGTFATMTVVIFSALSALGLSVALGITLSPTSAAAPVVILTVGIADSVHILVTYFQGMSKGLEKDQAIKESLHINHKPIFLTSLTTMIGFLSMNFNESPPFRDMGNIVAMGVLFAYTYSIFFLPVLIKYLPTKTGSNGLYQFRSIDVVEAFVLRHYVGVLLLLVFVVGGLGWSIQKMEFNDTFLEYFDETIDFRRNNDFFVEHLSGVEAIHYDVANRSGIDGSINEPTYLEQLGELKAWFESHPKVLNVESYSGIMYQLNQTWHDQNLAYYVAPDSRELAAQYLLMFELSLPAGLGIENFVNVNRSATRLSVALANAKTGELLEMDQQAQAWAKLNAPDLVVNSAVGESMLFAHEAKRNLRSMLNGVYVALIMISAVILIALRNVKLGFLSLLPNTVPIVMAFGLWALIVGELGMSGASVLVIALGIIVDDTVHFLSKYQRARRELNMSTEEAIRYSFQTVGVALLVTSIILVGGFSVLFESAFKPSKDLGLLIAFCVGLALIATFFLLPCLLMLLDRDTVTQVQNEESMEPPKTRISVSLPVEQPIRTGGGALPVGAAMNSRSETD